MSVPRLVLCGLEPGPALALTAGAVLALSGRERAARAVTVGVDLPLWRLLQASPGSGPRVLDPALHGDSMLELFDSWCAGSDLVLVVAVEPVLDRWQGVRGSRAVDLAAGLDAPLVLVLDATGRGATAGAAVLGARALAGRAQLAGVIVVGADEGGRGAELRALLRAEAGLPVLGWVPQRLSDQFARLFAGATGGAGPEDAAAAQKVCAEAVSCLDADEIIAAAAHRGYVPVRPKRLLAPVPAATGLTLAVASGSPLEPFAPENVDLLEAMGLRVRPFDLEHDAALPEGAAGLLLSGGLAENGLAAFAANERLKTALAAAVTGGLPTLAMGGGCLLLLDGLAVAGAVHQLAGALPGEAELLERYERPRYVPVRAAPGNPFDCGESVVYELFDEEFLLLEQGSSAYELTAPGGGAAEGFSLPRCLATTLVASLPGSPALTAGFVAAMKAAERPA
jgi:cobyrinic acid a,c-diamide synthase